jgi:hypothetical protein
MGVIAAGQAQALVVNVNGQDWDVTTFSGTYNANTSKFATATNGGVMPWWFNETAAAAFAIALDAQLGTPNVLDGSSGPPAGTGAGPFFGYVTNGIDNIMYGYGWVSNYGVGQGVIGFPSGVTSRTWAQATLFLGTAEAPGPLPALGTAAAFGFSRKLRKRIKSSANPISSSYTI